MDTINNSERIIASYSLFAFAQKFGSDIHTGICTPATGDKFPSCIFSDGNRRTFVDFGESLKQGLTFEEIVAMADDLQVVQLAVDPEVLERRRNAQRQLETYKLCKKGDSSWKGGNLFAALRK